MLGLSIADPGSAPNTAREFDAAIASGGSVAPRQWGFASDARAALMVCLLSADLLVVAGTGIISYLIRYGLFSIRTAYLANIVIGCVIFSLILHSGGMYRFPALRHRLQHLKRLSGYWAATILLLISTIYWSKLADELSRGWIVMWAVGGWAGLMGTRRLAWRVIRSLQARGRLLTHTAVVGYGSTAADLAARLQSNNNDDVQVIGVFEPASDLGDAPGSRAGRDLGCLLQLTASTVLDEIVVAMPCSQLAEAGSLLCELSAFPVDVKVYLDFAGAGRAGGPISVLVPIWERPLAGLPSVIKRGMDICLSAMMLIIMLPLMVMIAVLVKLDSPGPALFRQQRFGFSKKPFILYKFRSMRWEPDDDPSVPQARRNDPRVTRVGGLLRRASLDELPQFFNVLKGDMSLVGPRPHPTLLDDKFAAVIDRYLARHHVKPGITGWAQVNGFRGETDTLDKMERRVEHDLHYIDHWSPFLDLRILCMTLAAVLKQRNAY
jgi:Undecaprenyl-phosphate glucose phosphotransferase